LTFGVFGADGRVPVRITMDHRVFDGMEIAKIMARLEGVLNGPILQELRSIAKTPMAVSAA
jgi:pyruvate/2-oxoglutarate dehydrogenase complex dihydrolipoamide acyltransferase (E2) component